MADEILYAGIGDLTTAEALSTEYLLLLADRNALPNHPALVYVGDIIGRGSNVLKVPHIGLMGYDLLASTNDGTAVANSALTDGSSTVTIAKYSKSYEASDLAKMVQGNLLSPALFAQDAVVSGALTLTSLVANLVDNFATVKGASGVDATYTNFLDALTALEIAKVQGPYMAVLHNTQWGDIRLDIANSAGTVSLVPPSQEALTVRGPGYQGQLFGCDVFTSSFVPTCNGGADRGGGIFGRGAILWGDGSFQPEGDVNQMIVAGKVLFERARTAKAGLTAYVSHRYLGAAEGIDTCGVSLITDA